MTNPTNIFLRNHSGLLFLLPLLLVLSCSEKKEVGQTKEKPDLQAEKNFKILILGDSLTEGYGVDETEAYPTLLQEKLNLELSEKVDKTFEVINGGISGSTTSGGVSRIKWFLKSQPDFLILALGGNDGLRGIPVEQIKTNLEKVILAAQNNQIPILLAGMKIPPNYGKAYNQAFTHLYPTLSDQYDIPFIPFLLEGVGGNPEMNLPDRIHPNPKGHQVICELVYQSLQSILL
jgi:acyl-CoA thioesterase-1